MELARQKQEFEKLRDELEPEKIFPFLNRLLDLSASDRDRPGPGFFQILEETGQGSDTFTIRVATPAGLARMEDKGGIIAEHPLLVIKRFDYEVIWSWLQEKVSACQADTWEASVGNLRKYFNWEFGYSDSKGPQS